MVETGSGGRLLGHHVASIEFEWKLTASPSESLAVWRLGTLPTGKRARLLGLSEPQTAAVRGSTRRLGEKSVC